MWWAGVEPDELQTQSEPAGPQRLHQHSHRVPRRLPLRIRRQGGATPAHPHSLSLTPIVLPVKLWVTWRSGYFSEGCNRVAQLGSRAVRRKRQGDSSAVV